MKITQRNIFELFQDRSRKVDAPVPVFREIADAAGAATYEDFTDDSVVAASDNAPPKRVLKTGVDLDASVEYQIYQGLKNYIINFCTLTDQ